MSNYRGHSKAPGRFFDHVYDPLYTMAGSRDVWRNNAKSLAISGQVQIYPVYTTMFTDLPWRRRNYYVRQRNALPFDNTRVPDANASTCNNAHKKTALGTSVAGVDRAKFFDIPLGNTKTISLHLDMGRRPDQCKCAPKPCVTAADEISGPSPPFKTVGMQTVYRETSAQTRPWLPPAKIGDNEPATPEIVYVAEMMRDDPEGSVPGIYEAEMVARARKRREWEQSLPAISTFKEWNRRRLVLEAFEWEEWVGRENKMEYCQRLRLYIVQQMMMDRKDKTREQCALSVAKKTAELEKRKAQEMEQLRNKYRRRLKRYSNEHKGVPTRYRPNDIVSEQIDPSSDLYAPQNRFGVHPKHRHFMAHKTNFQARLENLRKTPNTKINCKAFLTTRIDLTKPKAPLTEVKRGLNTDKSLQALYEGLLNLRTRKEGALEPPRCLYYIQPVYTPKYTTPDDSEHDGKNEREYQMAVYIQRIIRGRAVQNQIYSGRDKCRELIAEFRTTHQLTEICELNAQDDLPNQLTEDRKYAHYQQMRLAAILRAEAQIMEMVDQAKGTTMAFALDLLETEMARLSDQRYAHALCILAENERYRREATEAGSRQRGDNRRRSHDEIARNVQLVKYNTIVDYLEGVLTNCMETMADKTAREHIRDVVRKIDEEAQDPTPLRVVTGILNRFVLPDVFTHIARENHLADVHRSLFGTVPDMISENKRARLNHFLAAAVSPRPVDTDNVSVISSLDSLEDPAHHEAIRCVEKAISTAFSSTKDFDKTGAYGLLDDILKSVIPDETESDKQLSEILTDLNDQLWDAVDAVDNDVDEMAPTDETSDDRPSLSLSVTTTINKDEAVKTAIWQLNDDKFVEVEDDERLMSTSTNKADDDLDAHASNLSTVTL